MSKSVKIALHARISIQVSTTTAANQALGAGANQALGAGAMAGAVSATRKIEISPSEKIPRAWTCAIMSAAIAALSAMSDCSPHTQS